MEEYRLNLWRYGFLGSIEVHPLRRVQAMIRARSHDREEPASMKPAHKHDCRACLFVGADTPQKGERRVNRVDMWIHPNRSGMHTLIRRYSSDPPDYASMTFCAVEPLPAKYQRVLAAWTKGQR